MRASGSRAAVEFCTECTMLLMCTFTCIECRCIAPPEPEPEALVFTFAFAFALALFGVDESVAVVMLLVIGFWSVELQRRFRGGGGA